jgi:hypothetical protein
VSHILLAPILACGLVVCLAAPARAELTAWDQAKVTALAKQLEDASKSLYDTFYKQPKVGAGQSRPYYRLQQDVRRLKTDARGLSRALADGKGRDETLPAYEDLMQTVRRAQDNAREVFTTKDVQDSAATARGLLNQISPYYDADAQPLEPATR